MRIAINTRLLLPGRMDGIGWFTYETVSRITAAHPEHQFLLLFDRPVNSNLHFSPNAEPIVLCPQARHPLLWSLFFDHAVPRALHRHRADLFVSTDGMMPLHPQLPTLTVIHDINFEHYPDNLRPSHQRFMTSHFHRYASAATRVATVSEYSRHDIATTYGISEEKIDVVYNGSHSNYRPLDDTQRATIRQQYTCGCPYIIFVSTILRRKNLANLLIAFDSLRNNHPQPLKLVVVGQRAWWADELSEAYNNMQHRDDVLLLGRAEPDLLASLMAAAEMLVYPSFFEGFGIPILEAMYAETPVIASRTTSMPEVGGDAALYINPSDPADIMQAMASLLHTPLRDQLIARGRLQRQRFGWDTTAELLWQSIMKTAATK